MQQQLVKLEGELKEQIKTLQGRIAALEGRFCCPPCEFIMYDFSKHKAADDEWLSPPFYSHPGGYKQRLAVYANGHGQYKGKQASFIQYTMKGEYDHQLEWPRTLATKIHLLNYTIGEWGRGVGYSALCTKHTAAQERRTCWHYIINSSHLQNDCIHFRVTEVNLS